MPPLRELYDLQTVDAELDRRQQRLAEISQRLGDERPLAKYRQAAAALRDSVRLLTSRQRELENQTADLTERIEAAEARLYGGTISNPRELRDLQTEIAHLQRRRSDHESALLQVMDDLEAEQARFETASKQLAKAERVWKAEQEKMTAEQAALQAEAASLAQERRAKAAAIPPADLALYEQVRKTRGGRAVALIRNGVCQSCRVGLPTRQMQAMKTSATVVRCPSCGLILLPEEP